MLVQLCSPSFLPSSIILFLFSLFFNLRTVPEVWGKWKEGVEQKEKKGERESAEIFYRGLWEPTDKGLHLNPS